MGFSDLREWTEHNPFSVIIYLLVCFIVVSFLISSYELFNYYSQMCPSIGYPKCSDIWLPFRLYNSESFIVHETNSEYFYLRQRIVMHAYILSSILLSLPDYIYFEVLNTEASLSTSTSTPDASSNQSSNIFPNLDFKTLLLIYILRVLCFFSDFFFQMSNLLFTYQYCSLFEKNNTNFRKQIPYVLSFLAFTDS